jgi:IS30 family transposase
MMMARKVANTTADEALRAQRSIFNFLPRHAVKTITADNGSEFAYHYKLEMETGIKTYFADPYSSFQRGTNEHFNGRLRKYLPKRTSFADLFDEELQDIIDEINNRPRKILGWRTPVEVFNELCSPRRTIALQN